MKCIITCGDTNGIGPEIAIKSLQYLFERGDKGHYVLIIPGKIFDHYYKMLNCTFHYTFPPGSHFMEPLKSAIEILTIPDLKMHLGKPTVSSGKSALRALETAKEILLNDKEAFLVTAPISKDACVMAGSTFHGHTEMLASWAKSASFMMLFVSRVMKGGLLTIHVPLKEVSRLLTPRLIENKLQVVYQSLKKDFNILNPRIALLGVNPHAGEEGLLGDEELKLFAAPKEKYGLYGPYPADAFFAARSYKNFDFVLSPYHDQLLIPFKMLSWKDGVNYTAGLPFVRTSPDHGAAYDIAGKGKANAESMLSAIKMGKKIFRNRAKTVETNR